MLQFVWLCDSTLQRAVQPSGWACGNSSFRDFLEVKNIFGDLFSRTPLVNPLWFKMPCLWEYKFGECFMSERSLGQQRGGRRHRSRLSVTLTELYSRSTWGYTFSVMTHSFQVGGKRTWRPDGGEKWCIHNHTYTHKQRGLKGHEAVSCLRGFGNPGSWVSLGKPWQAVCSDERGETQSPLELSVLVRCMALPASVTAQTNTAFDWHCPVAQSTAEGSWSWIPRLRHPSVRFCSCDSKFPLQYVLYVLWAWTLWLRKWWKCN